jgi:hypothetical protein
MKLTEGVANESLPEDTSQMTQASLLASKMEKLAWLVQNLDNIPVEL